jgi:hypothetical protein
MRSSLCALAFAAALLAVSAHFGYRFLEFHRDSGSTNQRVQMRGPYIALSYRF